MSSKKKKSPSLDLSSEELAELQHRLEQKDLNSADYDLILKILSFVNYLRNLLEKNRFNILSLLRRMFGLKTERKKGSARDHIGSDSKSGNLSPKTKGRNGKNDYPGAQRIAVAHECLKTGDLCPECTTGKLLEAEPGVSYEWKGQAPIALTIYDLERLICNLCKSIFTANPPSSARIKTVDDSADDAKVSRCDANASANAMVACLRYEYGVPNYRLAGIQSHAGLALPESTQWRMILQVYATLWIIFKELVYEAAQGELLQNDDTRMKVLDVIKEAKSSTQKPEQKKKNRRKTTRTSAIVAHSGDHIIVLYFTGTNNAGENLSQVLEEREDHLGPPLQMCDGLNDNAPDQSTIMGNCLTHGRRGFFDLYAQGFTSLETVIDDFKLIYVNDAIARERNMNPRERLEFHRKESAPVMKRLKQWMDRQLEHKIVEPNSALGKHIKYCLTRWDKMSLFLSEIGAPLANDEVERKIKRIVRHRKNSLFYKTERGAEVGDVIMSVIETCNEAGVSPFAYISTLQENRAKVLGQPHAWLPWNYQYEKN